MLTTGWSAFVASKKLVAGDSFVFLRYLNLDALCCGCLHFDLDSILSYRGENGQLRVGVRRMAQPQSPMPSSVVSSRNMRLGVLATASHSVMSSTLFTVYYKPRFVSILNCTIDVINL